MKIVKEECYKYYFERDKPGESLLNSQINIGDPVVISSEEGHFAIGIGYVTDLDSSHVAVSIGKPLLGIPIREKDFDKDTNQNFKYLKLLDDTNANTKGKDISSNILSSPSPCSQRYPMLNKNNSNLNYSGNYSSHNQSQENHSLRESHIKKMLYRIDKDEMNSAIGITRNNLLDLFRSQDQDRLRKLIVDLEKPKFNKKEMIIPKHIEESLDPYQKNAVERALSAIDYSLILGMPGTGKTTTITALIEILIKNNKKINQHIRRSHKVIEDNIDTVKKLKEFYDSKNIFATTCLGSSK
ncbi:hypothetical protein H8356DRAFT_1279262 [Neocallimastix lanati (nom. inval.)]|nr:hypothetical protein H8356DRAFT_1279262 [Neocallimastix sp. JGI-2020a]